MYCVAAGFTLLVSGRAAVVGALGNLPVWFSLLSLKRRLDLTWKTSSSVHYVQDDRRSLGYLHKNNLRQFGYHQFTRIPGPITGAVSICYAQVAADILRRVDSLLEKPEHLVGPPSRSWMHSAPRGTKWGGTCRITKVALTASNQMH